MTFHLDIRRREGQTLSVRTFILFWEKPEQNADDDDVQLLSAELTKSKCLTFITFHVSCRRCEMYSGHGRPCVSVSVCLSVLCRSPTLLHGPGCDLGEWWGVPSSYALLGGFAREISASATACTCSVRGFHVQKLINILMLSYYDSMITLVWAFESQEECFWHHKFGGG